MHTDRRVYWTTAIVALVVALAISFLARSDPLTAVTSAGASTSVFTSAQGGGFVLHEVQPTSSTVQAVGVTAL
jgi:hypothetical protein